jgi:membrane associated rhomboid family serine protease
MHHRRTEHATRNTFVCPAIDELPPFLQRFAMSDIPPIAMLLTVLVTVIVTLRGFKDEALREKFIFNPEAILLFKEYRRIVTSALLHLDGNHLFGNMLTLFLFGSSLESVFGSGVFLLVYLGSIIGGSFLSLWLHRHHEYRALGASGGVCGIMFAWILLFPGGGINPFFLPLGIPGWIYAVLYLAYSFFAMKHGWSNVGHDAHIGGAVIGLLIAAAIKPAAVAQSPWLFLTILGLSSLMFLYLWKNPLMLPLKHFLPERRSRPKPPARTAGPAEDEVNAVLDKVARQGINSLSAKERKILEQAAKR